jgi:hypothetical protein
MLNDFGLDRARRDSIDGDPISGVFDRSGFRQSNHLGESLVYAILGARLSYCMLGRTIGGRIRDSTDPRNGRQVDDSARFGWEHMLQLEIRRVSIAIQQGRGY